MPITQTPSIAGLKRAVEIAEQIQKLQSELAGILNNGSAPNTEVKPQAADSPSGTKPRKKKRMVSAESRAKMAEAQRARWAKKKAA